MFSKNYTLVIFLFFCVFFSSDVEAGCNGSCPTQEGQNWIVTEHTSMWDETIKIDDLIVMNGKRLELDNVNINISGDITLDGDTTWSESTIIHWREEAAYNVSVYQKLEIIGSNVTLYINLSDDDSYLSQNEYGIYLAYNSDLIIKDLDDNPLTEHDASTIKPGWRGTQRNVNGYAAWKFIGHQFSKGEVSITNSILVDVWSANIYANDTLFTGNKVYGDRNINFRGDNLTFTNNFLDSQALNSSRPFTGWMWNYGGNALYSDNTFIDGQGAIAVSSSGENYTIINNDFFNLTSNVIYLSSASNISMTHNNFTDINTAVWQYNTTDVVFRNNNFINGTSGYGTYFSGSNVRIYDNNFSNCTDYCILLTSLGSTGSENISVYKNHFHNFTVVGLGSTTGFNPHNNITINNNTFEEGEVGISSDAWYSYLTLPNNVKIVDNHFANITAGVELRTSTLGGVELLGGENYLIARNVVKNTTNGIFINHNDETYDSLLVEKNNLETKEYGINIRCFEDRITNNRIYANNIISEYIAISITDCGQYYIENNNLTSKEIGIDVYDSGSHIQGNEIMGDCQDDECKKVSFSKVANIGISIYDDSEVDILNNDIGNFYTSIRLLNSEANRINTNSINFTNTGIYAHGSTLFAQGNHINNSYYAINSELSELEIENLDIYSYTTGINSFNSTYDLTSVKMQEGLICMNFIDSEYIIDEYSNLDCPEAMLYEKYFFKVRIQTNSGTPSPQHQFQYKNALQDNVVNGFTKDDGDSAYFLATSKKIDNSGLPIIFNPYQFFYTHNGIQNSINYEINKNSTIIAYLDTIPPETTISANHSLINSLDIYLTFTKLSMKNDLKDYDLYVLINDGINFAEWEYVGTYNNTIVKYSGEDGTKYRFKTISRDLFGNVEIKNEHDFEVEIDIQTPVSFFEGIGSDYYFTSNDEILLDWNSEDEDISYYQVDIYYTNFTTDYLDPNTIVWTKIESYTYFTDSSIKYNMEDVGHYAFKLLSVDSAGNEETKSKYDFVINFDPSSDTMSFVDIPKSWGQDTLEIDYVKASFNLNFNLFLAMESVEYDNPYFTWYSHPHEQQSETIVLSGLLDKTRYYLFAESTDLAGNIENPLNTTEYFSSNGEYDQKFSIKYIPLLMQNYNFIVEIDNDFDGIYETKLALGDNLEKLDSNEFFVDKQNKTLHFGGVNNGGFVPNQDLDKTNNIKIKYSGVHAIFEVYTGNPEPAQNLEIIPTNITHIVFEYNVPSNSDNCKVQRTTNLSKGWFNQEILSPCLKGAYEYEHLNPEPNSKYFYRIMIEDEFGHISVSESRSIDMNDVVKIYSASNTSQGDQSIDSIILLTATAGALMLAFGGVLLYRTKDNDNLEENVAAIESKPVAKYKVEELYLIYKDGRLIRNISAVEVKTDSEIMSGMLTAINDFVQDSFNTEGDLGDIGYGNNKIVLQRGQNSYLAAVIYGEVDNIFKAKMINAVRAIERENPSMASWNGDSESIGRVKINLKPIIDETSNVTREMVDNYFTEKDLAITTDSEKIGDIINLKVNISNYSSTVIQNCKIRPEINSSILTIIGIEPDLAYHFSDNLFNLGEINSYNEVQLEIKLRAKTSESTAIEIKMSYDMKGKEGDLSSVTQIN